MTKRFQILIVVFGLPAILAARGFAGQGVNTLKGLTSQKTEKGVDITVRIEGEFLYQAQALSNPTRLALDLSPVQKIEAPLYTEINEFGLTSIRTGQFTPMIARVVFDFSGAMPGYAISKTDTGLVVRFSAEAQAPETITPPIQTKPVPVAKPVEEKPISNVAQTETELEAGEEPERFANTMIGVFTGSYQIPSVQFQEIYGSEAVMTTGFSLSRTLVKVKSFTFDVEGAIRWYSKIGASTLSQEAATFKMTPKSLTGRLGFKWKYIMVFAGYGLDWYSYSEESTLTTVPTEGTANGHHFTAGIYLIPPMINYALRLKFYYKFTKVTATANGIDVDLGGNEYGIGLSIGFNILKKGVLSF
jgi:hypothetical protein